MTKDICSRTIVDNYEQRVIIMIKNNEEIKNYIRRTYFSKLNDMLMIYLIDHQAQGEKYNSDNSKILDNFSESIGKDFVMYFEIFSIICVPVYL